ncbi:MAG: CsbD family protein [Novosphingobium sp.]
MGEFIDKAKGAADEVIGKAKVALGKETESSDLVAKGLAQEAKGHAEKIIGAAKGVLGNKL